MSDTTIVSDKGLDLIQQYADKISSIVKEYGPQVTQLALDIGRISAIQDLVYGGLGVAILLGIAVNSIFVFKCIKNDPGLHSLFNHLYVVISVFVSILFAIGGGYLIYKLLDIFSWVGIFHPEIYLAAKALNL